MYLDVVSYPIGYKDNAYYVQRPLTRREKSLHDRCIRPFVKNDGIVFVLVGCSAVAATLGAIVCQIAYWAGDAAIRTYTPVLILWIITLSLGSLTSLLWWRHVRNDNPQKYLLRRLGNAAIKIDSDPALLALWDECEVTRGKYRFNENWILRKSVFDRHDLVDDFLIRTSETRFLSKNIPKNAKTLDGMQRENRLAAYLRHEAKNLVDLVRADEAERSKQTQREAKARAADAKRIEAAGKAAADAVANVEYELWAD